MPREPPIVLPVLLSQLRLANPWALLLAKEEGYPLSTASLLSERYAMKSDEKPFARELLGRKPNLWVFRCDQRRFAGDFVVVDMAEPRPARRQVVVLDLKMGAPLVLGGGGAGVQLTHAQDAVEGVAARKGVIAPGTPYMLATGDKDVILAWLRE
ncbi:MULTISPECIES: hypothetical protein [Myxococcus]|uniref:Uncharacterized protein n=1 Tax=Myxococcus llanfairpwllgwyngyllgogerychwyrndrobwllllantysiliogogogochensis TaxID=2590453 RepID=A0A540WV72_9BACT|nr:MULTISPECIES: hypothetical protein [Myxococcus]NTX01386.1 hypothetical protein [Myxococcus sp. CA040A]TQF12925.1 hypothetical protein FJV41_26565 [Myxococcus llanfairpwllgwyngyllgogerychwyrndrobwllllantysiliogogogochensis]